MLRNCPRNIAPLYLNLGGYDAIGIYIAIDKIYDKYRWMCSGLNLNVEINYTLFGFPMVTNVAIVSSIVP